MKSTIRNFGFQRLRLLMACCTLFAASATAQVTTATFYGLVTDPTAALIRGAAVTLTNSQTTEVFHKTSGSTGEFEFDFLPVGTYTLRIEAQGFKAFESKGIALSAGQQARQTYALGVGSVSETVSVEGTAPLLNAVSSEQQQSIDASESSQLPVQKNNFSSLLSVGTGVSNAGGAIRMNGVGKTGTGYSVDGTNASGNTEGRLASTYGASDYVNIMSMQGIEEIQTIKGTMPAEYGDALGGHVNLIAKSGTNRWHFGLFENFQSEVLNARNQSLTTKAPVTFNQYGGFVGGPIRKNRIFFFVDYEGYHENAFQVVQGSVPTQQVVNQLEAAVPLYTIALATLPLPNQPTAPNATTGVYLAAATLRHWDNHVDAKGDIIITDTNRLSLTYSHGRPYERIPGIYVNGIDDRQYFNTLERGTAALTHGGTSWTSESRFGYSLANLTRTDAFFNVLNPTGAKGTLAYGEIFPLISTSLGWSTASSEFYNIVGPTINADQKISKTIGKHSLKFGGDYLSQCCSRTNPQNPSFSYQTLAQLMSNTPTAISPTFGNGVFTAHLYEFGFFAQDDYRLAKNLVLNVGLRYDYYSNLVAHGNPNGGATTAFYNPDGLLDSNFHVGPIRPINNPYNPDAGVNLGPRFGFAYSPGANGKTVIRGGFGIIFSAQVPGAMWQSVQVSQAIPFRAANLTQQQILSQGLKFPLYNDDIAKIITAQEAATGVTSVFSVFNPNLQNPYTEQYSFSIQRELAGSLMLESAFVGVRGVKLLTERLIDTPDRITGLLPNPSLAATYYVDSSQQSAYTSWQTSLRKRYSRNLSGSAHFTWSKALSTEGGDIGAYYQGDTNTGYIQNFFDMKGARGPSAGDVKFYFVTETLYDLPSLKGWTSGAYRAGRLVLGGWQVSGIVTAQTGGAVTLTQSSTLSGSRPDYTGGNPTLSNYSTTLQYLNPAAFTKVPLSTASGETIRAGNIGTGAIRTPGLWNVDFSLGKNFNITEKLRLQYRLEMFNALNHTNLSGLIVEITNPRFGQLTGTAGARVMQMNAHLSW
ncbi:MAG TPA: TonB-dependent receptor [Candidatus Acidoferrales bacterium]|nr:TonB-dependent receptor [Candidatus Acidoferrales bacterium]